VETQNTNLFSAVILILAIIIITIIVYPMLFGVVSDKIGSALNSVVTPVVDVAEILLLIPIILILFFLVLKRKYSALFYTILFSLPVLSRIGEFLPVLKKESVSIQFSSSGLLLILISLYLFLSHGDYCRKLMNNKYIKYMFYSLLLGSFAQLFNNTMSETIYILINRIWCYFAVIIVAGFAIRNENDVAVFFSRLPYIFLVYIMFRILNNGGHFIEYSYNHTDYTGAVGKYWRASSVLGPGITYGGYLAMTAVVNYFQIKKNKNNLLYIILGLLLLIELILTFSRGGLMVLFFIIILYVMLNKNYSIQKRVRYVIIFIIIALIAQNVNNIFFPSRAIYYNSGLGQISAVKARFYLWGQSLNHIFDNYGFGRGIGNQLRFMVNIDNYNEIYKTGLPSHNFIFSSIQSIGLFASILLFYNLFRLISGLFKTEQKSAIITGALLTGWIAFAFIGNADLWVGYPVEGGFIFILFFYIGVVLLNKKGLAN